MYELEIIVMRISIHTAFAGCDIISEIMEVCKMEISIHTAFAGCDFYEKLKVNIKSNFNPHSLRRL